MLSLIAAVSKNYVIGKDNQLLWHLPNDFAFFKQHTIGKKIVMGRKTWESLPTRPLPKRQNIVMSSRSLELPPAVEQWQSIDQAKDYVDSDEEIMVIGGAQVYAQLMPLAQRLYLTMVAAELAGDAYFPPVDQTYWRCTFEQENSSDAAHQYDYTFTIWNRKGASNDLQT